MLRSVRRNFVRRHERVNPGLSSRIRVYPARVAATGRGPAWTTCALKSSTFDTSVQFSPLAAWLRLAAGGKSFSARCLH